MQHGPAASSGTNPKAPGSAGGYLLPKVLTVATHAYPPTNIPGLLVLAVDGRKAKPRTWPMLQGSCRW
jgi:hypothetical protein